MSKIIEAISKIDKNRLCVRSAAIFSVNFYLLKDCFTSLAMTIRFLRWLLVSMCLVCVDQQLPAQDFGLSFSYFIPKNGYFSTPISPFSIRGVGVSLTDFLSVETGASLYRMAGLNMKDLPFETKDPLIGPNFTVFVPGEIVIELKGSRAEFDIKGGGFVFYGLGNKINYGNLDRALRAYENWTVANADVGFDNNPGFGWMAGAELTIYVTQQLGISLETNYLAGSASFPLNGTYTGGTTSLESKSIDYADAKLDLTGLEFSLSVIISSGGGGKAKPRRRR
jgi:hypothetical protein